MDSKIYSTKDDKMIKKATEEKISGMSDASFYAAKREQYAAEARDQKCSKNANQTPMVIADGKPVYWHVE